MGTINETTGITTAPVETGDDASAADTGTAVGEESEATGDNTAAFGLRASATGQDATALGADTLAPAQWNTVVGYNAGGVNNGDNIALLGRNALGTGDNSVAVGESAEALAVGATALGFDSRAEATNSIALGSGTVATLADAIAVGARDREMAPDTSIVYAGGADDEVLANLLLAGDENAGDPLQYDLQIGGETVLTVRAEADGQGGIQNVGVTVPDEIDVGTATADTLEATTSITDANDTTHSGELADSVDVSSIQSSSDVDHDSTTGGTDADAHHAKTTSEDITVTDTQPGTISNGEFLKNSGGDLTGGTVAGSDVYYQSSPPSSGVNPNNGQASVWYPKVSKFNETVNNWENTEFTSEQYGSAGEPAIGPDAIYGAIYNGLVVKAYRSSGVTDWTYDNGTELVYDVAYNNGKIIIQDSSNNVTALTKTGAVDWTFTSTNDTYAVASSDVPTYKNKVVVRDSNTIYALDVSDGSQTMSFYFGVGDIVSDISISPSGIIVFSTGGNTVYAVDIETGNELWTRSESRRAPAVSTGSGVVAYGTEYSSYAVDIQNGETLRSIEAGDVRTGDAIRYGNWYVGVNDKVKAFDLADGSIIWSNTVGYTNGINVDDGCVVTNDANGNVVNLDAFDGSQNYSESNSYSSVSEVNIRDGATSVMTDGRELFTIEHSRSEITLESRIYNGNKWVMNQ